MNKLTVEYDPDKGQAFPDNESIKYVDAICETYTNTHIVVGTEFLLLLFRKAIVKKEIKLDEIEFLFKGRKVEIDKYGCWSYRPKGFDGVATPILSEIIHAQMDMRQEDWKNEDK